MSNEPQGEPEVLYVVRDEQGRILEIATTDGQRIYVEPEGQQPEVPEGQQPEVLGHKGEGE